MSNTKAEFGWVDIFVHYLDDKKGFCSLSIDLKGVCKFFALNVSFKNTENNYFVMKQIKQRIINNPASSKKTVCSYSVNL